MQEAEEKSLVVAQGRGIAQAELPRLLGDAGAAAGFAWEEFFIAKIRNGYTRRAYLHAVRSFLRWAEPRQVELARITPGMVGQYFDELPVSTPTKKLHLAGIRAFFDVLVQRHVIVLNPAHSVRTEKYTAVEGRTPEITVEQARQLLASIKIKTVVDLRDRAVIATLIYTAARAGAVAKLRLKDLATQGAQLVLAFREKNGKARSIPVRADLHEVLLEYLSVLGFADESRDAPLFRTAGGRAGRLCDRAMTNVDICRMVK